LYLIQYKSRNGKDEDGVAQYVAAQGVEDAVDAVGDVEIYSVQLCALNLVMAERVLN
jgi:hypothetical protein